MGAPEIVAATSAIGSFRAKLASTSAKSRSTPESHQQNQPGDAGAVPTSFQTSGAPIGLHSINSVNQKFMQLAQ